MVYPAVILSQLSLFGSESSDYSNKFSRSARNARNVRNAAWLAGFCWRTGALKLLRSGREPGQPLCKEETRGSGRADGAKPSQQSNHRGGRTVAKEPKPGSPARRGQEPRESTSSTEGFATGKTLSNRPSTVSCLSNNAQMMHK